MTVREPSSKRQLRMIELNQDQIRVSYNDGSIEIDSDPLEEDGAHSVDIFIKPNELGDGDKFVLTQEKFRSRASLWGPVRETLGSEEERSMAQRSFGFAEARGNVILRNFITALQGNQVRLKRTGPREPYRLFYRDPQNGMERIFHLYSAPGATKSEANRVVTLSLEEEDGIRVSINSPARLGPIQESLNGWLRNLRLANEKK